MRRPQRNRVKVYDSHCCDIRARGTAQQVRDKYITLARETDDKILAESYLQQAEHYRRIMENEDEVQLPESNN